MTYKGAIIQHPAIQKFIPYLPLKSQMVIKGAMGRHLSLTGSPRFPGAATFPAMSALQMGVDLTYLLLPPEHNLLLLSRMKSSDLMVSPLPLYDEKNKSKFEFKNYSNNITCIVFGPGLSRITDLSYKNNSEARNFYKNSVLAQLNILLSSLEQNNKIPIVIDADGLFLITQTREQIENEEDHPWFDKVRSLFKQILKNGNDRIILTPNSNEYKYLESTIKNKIYDISDSQNALMCLIKGQTDKIGFLTDDGFDQVLECDIDGGLKRCGGLGDCLTGCISTLLGWLESTNKSAKITKHDYLNGVFAGCSIMKLAGKRAFEEKGISCVAEDVIAKIPQAREEALGDFINRTENINDTSTDKITKQ